MSTLWSFVPSRICDLPYGLRLPSGRCLTGESLAILVVLGIMRHGPLEYASKVRAKAAEFE